MFDFLLRSTLQGQDSSPSTASPVSLGLRSKQPAQTCVHVFRFKRLPIGLLVVLYCLALCLPPLSAATTPTLSAVSCGSTSMTGSGTKACSVYLTNPTTTKVVVTLSSDNPAVRVPASVTLAVGASHTGFTTTVASVSSTQTANVTGNSIGISKVFVLQLNPAMATLSINPGSIPFGNVTVNRSEERRVGKEC